MEPQTKRERKDGAKAWLRIYFRHTPTGRVYVEIVVSATCMSVLRHTPDDAKPDDTLWAIAYGEQVMGCLLYTSDAACT